MRIKEQKKNKEISAKKAEQNKYCNASRETIVFSFNHICGDKKHNFCAFEDKKFNNMPHIMKSLLDKLDTLSSKTWQNINDQKKDCGLEYLPVIQFNEKFINSLPDKIMKDDKLISIRFNGKKCRLIVRRGTKCNRVCHILGIDCDLSLYKH